MNNYLLFGIISILVVSIIVAIIVIRNRNIQPVVRYSCKSGKCVLDPNGKYTTNICDDECGKTPTPTPTKRQAIYVLILIFDI